RGGRWSSSRTAGGSSWQGKLWPGCAISRGDRSRLRAGLGYGRSSARSREREPDRMPAPMSKKPSLADRYHYAFDALMARGAWALITWHLLIALAAVLLVSLLAITFGAAPVDDDGEVMSLGGLFWST